MTVYLRPHHLLCVLTFVGKGYNPAFTANLQRVTERLAAGEGVVLVDGPDDICQPLADDPDAHCHGESAAERDRLALKDITALLDMPLTTGAPLSFDQATIARLRQAFAGKTIRKACDGCPWRDLCTEVARDDFAGAKLPG